MGRASRRRKAGGRAARKSWPLENNPVIRALVAAWNALDDAAVSVLAMAAPIGDLGPYGTDELATALSALDAARNVEGDDGERLVGLPELEDAARWVSRACTMGPLQAVASGGEDGMAFVGSVVLLRGALMKLDEARERTP